MSLLSLAPYRYRNILESEGGPIAKIECSPVEAYGMIVHQAAAFLADHCTFCSAAQRDREKGFPDGAGTHKSPVVARFMAISEALERWALSVCVTEPEYRSKHGFDLDFSSNGMAAFPGVLDMQARKRAFSEAIERHCLLHWWEGNLGYESITTNLRESVRAIRLQNPFSDHVVVVLWEFCDQRFYSYSFGYGQDTEDAVHRAVVELDRSTEILRELYAKDGVPNSDLLQDHLDIFEKRMLYFSLPEGFDLFVRRLENVESQGVPPLTFHYDGPIEGPWSKYSTVWRVVLVPPALVHLTQEMKYFFW